MEKGRGGGGKRKEGNGIMKKGEGRGTRNVSQSYVSEITFLRPLTPLSGLSLDSNGA